MNACRDPAWGPLRTCHASNNSTLLSAFECTTSGSTNHHRHQNRRNAHASYRGQLGLLWLQRDSLSEGFPLDCRRTMDAARSDLRRSGSTGGGGGGGTMAGMPQKAATALAAAAFIATVGPSLTAMAPA